MVCLELSYGTRVLVTMSRNETIFDAFHGPLTIRIFTTLLVAAAMIYVVGHVWSIQFDFVLLEAIGGFFVNRPGMLLSIAGVIAFAIIGYRIYSGYITD